MNLHKNREAFLMAVKIAAKETGIRPIFLEKDYWVSVALKRLADSAYVNDAVFKGGTSLSKCHNVIDRFSEDIDLAITRHNDRTPGDIKRLLKKIEHVVVADLSPRPDDTGKKGLKRTTTHDYERLVSGADSGALAGGLTLEITAYSQTFPSDTMNVDSYISRSLDAKSRNDIIDEFQLEPFAINVLGIERTFAEKIMALVKLSYSKDNISRLKEKIRHVYDLQQILANSLDARLFLQSESFFNFIDAVAIDDNFNKTSDLRWIERNYGDCILFGRPEGTWMQIETAYVTTFKELVFGDLPGHHEIIEALHGIGDRLRIYDKWRHGHASVGLNEDHSTGRTRQPSGPKM